MPYFLNVKMLLAVLMCHSQDEQKQIYNGLIIHGKKVSILFVEDQDWLLFSYILIFSLLIICPYVV